MAFFLPVLVTVKVKAIFFVSAGVLRTGDSDDIVVSIILVTVINVISVNVFGNALCDLMVDFL